MAEKAIGKAERETALKALIRATIAGAGSLAPDAIPHRIKEQLKGQATGDVDIDRLIRDALAEQKTGKG